MSAPTDRDSLLAFMGWDVPAWQKDAACKEHPELSWFPATGQNQARQHAVCAGCLVRVECLAAGEGEFGTWGGLSERARRRGVSVPTADAA